MAKTLSRVGRDGKTSVFGGGKWGGGGGGISSMQLNWNNNSVA